jgi:membrane protease subunit (stomatin/prohibitin family)
LERVQTQDLETQIKALIVSAFSDTLGEAKISAFDLAAKYSELGGLVEKAVAEKFAFYGLQLRQFVLENISLPPEVEAIIDKRSSMGVIGNVDQYMKFNVADKAGEAISQPGGMAGTLAGAGLGLALGGQIAGQMGGPVKPAFSPPPLPTDNIFAAIEGKQQGPFNLAQLKQMAAEAAITRDTLVWKEGMAAWAAASGVADIAVIFSGVPPKIPG